MNKKIISLLVNIYKHSYHTLKCVSPTVETLLHELKFSLYMLSRMYFIIWMLFISILVSAQSDSFRTGIEASHETSYITVLGGVGRFYPLLFESAIVPYYTVILSHNANLALEVSPKILLRMYNERSMPVRTPSYMPRVNFYYGMGKTYRNLEGLFLFLSWAHHSNGQSGYFYNPDSVTINTLTGNFATNFIEFGPFLKRKPTHRKLAVDFLKITGEYHYRQDTYLQGKYGRFRMNMEFQSITVPWRIIRMSDYNDWDNVAQLSNRYTTMRLAVKTSLIFGDKQNTPATDLLHRFNLSLTTSFRPARLNDLTLFVQYYYGQDYYNIYFNNTISVLRFGLQADTFHLFNRN
jgi:hypothetical protein